MYICICAQYFVIDILLVRGQCRGRSSQSAASAARAARARQPGCTCEQCFFINIAQCGLNSHQSLWRPPLSLSFHPPPSLSLSLSPLFKSTHTPVLFLSLSLKSTHPNFERLVWTLRIFFLLPRHRVNSAHTRQSRPEPGLGLGHCFQANVFEVWYSSWTFGVHEVWCRVRSIWCCESVSEGRFSEQPISESGCSCPHPLSQMGY